MQTPSAPHARACSRTRRSMLAVPIPTTHRTFLAKLGTVPSSVATNKRDAKRRRTQDKLPVLRTTRQEYYEKRKMSTVLRHDFISVRLHAGSNHRPREVRLVVSSGGPKRSALSKPRRR